MKILAGTRRWLRWIAPERGALGRDLAAGLPGSVTAVPEGMAHGLLAGVSPVHGLYAGVFGPIGGGLTVSTRMMAITTTTAAALAAGSAVESVPEQDRPRALFLLTVLAGGVMVVAGVMKLGRYTRFVPHSVMIGFLSGVSANIICGQLALLAGAKVSGPIALARAWDLITHPGRIDLGALVTGLSALGLMAALKRTRLATYSTLIALVVPALVVSALPAGAVPLVRDGVEIPSGLPMPALPRLSDLSFSLVSGAFAVAAVILVQGAGIRESAPNRDKARSDPNQDFVAQGVGSLLAGLFRGMPVGGSTGRTALNISAGAAGRWATIFSGLWMAVVLLLFSDLLGSVVVSTLSAVLIFAAVGSFRVADIRAIMRTGHISQIAVLSTFVGTLFLPIAAAVGVGLVVSLLMQLNQEALDLRVVELLPQVDGSFLEQPAAPHLESHRVVVLDVYGSLFYAGARTLQAQLPDPAPTRQPAVVLRLRGRVTLGATAFLVLCDYAERLTAVGGRLFVSGIEPALLEQARKNRTLENVRGVELFPAGEVVGESTIVAYRAAQRWLSALE
ncbi:SulP family inorganic anion transporter [Actinoplanes sp. NPDC049118]|uniref:SulP family inorganic anion transporter n=1 Tax=Actinoplanes sp. NPDC049118 TaxID=3155769 RepID=UPI0033DA6935